MRFIFKRLIIADYAVFKTELQIRLCFRIILIYTYQVMAKIFFENNKTLFNFASHLTSFMSKV